MFSYSEKGDTEMYIYEKEKVGFAAMFFQLFVSNKSALPGEYVAGWCPLLELGQCSYWGNTNEQSGPVSKRYCGWMDGWMD
ncbi:hypothetical protein BLOT_016706 [Blomia tropicalis]|nr:hypothetical protein BLOT_016706 [Blomia tropicalis]